jgi:putative ABC transport system substrate-binding protein
VSQVATSTIPIVAAPIGTDPVRAGVAESWAHPGGNITGVCLIAPELEVKRLSLLREALPSVHRVAVMSNHRKIVEAGLPALRKAAAEVGLELVEYGLRAQTTMRPLLRRCAIAALKPSISCLRQS